MEIGKGLRIVLYYSHMYVRSTHGGGHKVALLALNNERAEATSLWLSP